MTTRATTRATTRSTTRGINAVIGAVPIPPPAWTPASLSNLRQWLGSNYYASPVGGLQVIESLETHGTVRAPQPGCCALFDGVNDYGYLGVDPIPLMASGAITAWIEPNGGSGLQFLVACRDPDRIYLGYSASNEIYITLGSTNFTNTGVTETTRTHVAVRWTGGTFWVYRNGVQIYTGAYSGSTGGTSSCIGAYSASGNNASANYFKGCIHDLRIYNAVKSEAELLAIYNTDFSNPDTTGLWAGWYFNDRAGVVVRDWSGNGHDLTLSGPITESTFWAEDSSITANPFNVLGGTIANNLVTYSEQLDNAAWTKSEATITANAANNSQGVLTADLIVPSTNNALHYIYQAIFTAATPQTLSFDAKTSGYDYLAINTAGSVQEAIFNVTAGTVQSSDPSIGSISISSLGNGWYRYTIKFTPNFATLRMYASSNSTNASFAGNGTSGVLVTRVQLENGSAETTYTPTTSTAFNNVVIPRDESDPTKDVQGNALQYTGLSPYPATLETPCITFNGTSDYASRAALAGLTGDVAYTLCAWVNHVDGANIQVIIGQDDNVGYHEFGLAFDGARKIQLRSYEGGYSTTTGTTNIPDGWVHVAATRAVGGVAKLYINGVLEATGTAAAVVSTTHLRLGAVVTSYYFASSITNARVYSVEKSAAELLAIIAGTDDRTGLEASYKCQEGPGPASDNRTLYDDSGNGNHLTVVGGTVSVQRANRCPGYVKDHCVEYGGGLGAAGEFVPTIPGTSLCADGSTPTIAAGTITPEGNPWSRTNWNPYSAAEQNDLATPTAHDALPCWTGNGTDNHIDLGSSLIPATADLAITVWYYHSSSADIYSIFDQRTDAAADLVTVASNLSDAGGGTYVANKLTLVVGNSPWTYVTSSVDLVVGTWNEIRLTRVGNLFTLYLNGVAAASTTLSFSITQTANTLVAVVRSGVSYLRWNPGRFSSFAITTGGTTKYFPLTDGSGADVVYYVDGVATVISNAVQGTLTNVWANTTSGSVDFTFPEALRAIVPRDTKFVGSDGKDAMTFDAALTGTDLSDILGYLA